jgi:hypothetical protein
MALYVIVLDLDLEFGREASEHRLWAILSHCGS